MLELVAVSHQRRQLRGPLAVHADVVQTEIVIAQHQGVVEDFVQLDGGALGLVLPRKAEQVLDDAMRALRLLEKDFDILVAARADVRAAGQQLAVPYDGRERIIQLVRHPGD